MKKFFILLIVFIFTFSSAVAADNYLNELSEYALWKNQKRIKVWVQPSTKYTTTVYNAFREWEAAGGGCIHFVQANNESTANIRVYFVPKVADGVAGNTQHRSAGKYMLSANIWIGYVVPGRRNQTLSKDNVFAVAVHEIGHALGIMGHSSNRNDIMYPTTDVIGIHASNRDVNTIREFYCSGKY